MYYILNGTNQVIAADNELLTLCGVSHINDLYANIILKKISFNLTASNFTLSTPNKEYHFLSVKTSLSTMLGHLILVTIYQENQEDKSISPVKKALASDITPLNIFEGIKKPEIKPINIFEKSEEEKTSTVIPAPAIPEEKEDLVSQLTFEEEENDEVLEDFDMSLELEELETESKEKAPEESVSPQENLAFEDDLDLDALLALDAQNDETLIQEEKVEEEKIEEEDDLDLDELFALDAQNDETPAQEEKVEEEKIEEEDDLDLDELFALDAQNDETPIQEEKVEETAPVSSEEEGDFDFDMDIDALFDVDESATPQEKEEEEVAEIENDLDMDALFALDAQNTTEVEEPEEEVATFENDLDMDALFEVDENAPIKAPEEEVVESDDDDVDLDALFALDAQDSEALAIETPKKPEESEEEDTSEILVNITQLSEDIGISTEDYNAFLDEYIDAAIGLEEDIRGTDAKKHESAMGTLSHLCDVLRLPYVGDIITHIDEVSSDKREKAIDTFYATLSRITTYEASEAPTAPTIEKEVPKQEVKKEPVVEPVIEKVIETPALVIEPEPIPEVVVESEPVNPNSFGVIDLEGIKPKHFDFQLEEAANDLSLPVELIEEFVLDFIEQAKEETTKMLEAYKKGDLDAIQKIGHLLKGTSSNLRIKPLADTLYKIQFCEDSSQLEQLIKDYWAHFLSFEIQIKTISR